MSAPTLHLSNPGDRDGGADGTLHLTVMAPDVFSTYPLPPVGVVTIGRDESADVRITDEGASRLHARLHVGPAAELFIEDLGTSNGTFLRDGRLEPGSRVSLQPGEAVTVGYTILMVQRRRPPAMARRCRSHGTFEERLEDACERAQRSGATFALVRLHVRQAGAGAGAGPRAVELIAGSLRTDDLLAQYAPGEYEVLLLDTATDRAHAIAGEVAARLASKGVTAKAVVAAYPTDGRSAEALIGCATARLRGAATGARTGAGTGTATTLEAGEGAAREPVLKSEGMRKLYHLAERAAAGQTAGGLINVLVLGETGTGKEVLAAFIHRSSPRAKGPYVCINCAALSESLLESELFGHEKGAFTGAAAAKAGLLEAAAGGTILLDEIGEMPAALQTRLLRALEAREVTRVGAVKPRPIDVRFIAATNRDLEAEVAAKTFRQDLYFRLNGISLTLPPLRARREEIEPLARQFLAEASAAGRRTPPRLSDEAVELLSAYSWPGNIRELRNMMERALVLCEGDQITGEHLPVEKMSLARLGAPVAMELVAPAPASAAPGTTAAPGTPAGAVILSSSSVDPEERELTAEERVERQQIMRVMEACAGSQTRAAERLGISRGTLIARLKQYNIPRPRAPRG